MQFEVLARSGDLIPGFLQPSAGERAHLGLERGRSSRGTSQSSLRRVCRHSDAITAFFWLWSFFEGHYIPDDPERDNNENRAVPKIERFIDRLLIRDARQVDAASFAEPLNHFSARYFPRGVENAELYSALNVRWKRQLVRDVLSGRDVAIPGTIVALLVVAYCLRNNMVHGPKWRMDLAQQRGNFENANAVLIAAMEIDDRHLIPPAPQEQTA